MSTKILDVWKVFFVQDGHMIGLHKEGLLKESESSLIS